MSVKWCLIVIRIIFLLKTNRRFFILGISCRDWILLTIRCCRDVCFFISIYKLVVLVGRIFMRFRLIVRFVFIIIFSVTVCIVWGSILIRRITNRIRLTIIGRAKYRRGRNAAVLNYIRSAWKVIKFASVVYRLANIIFIRVCFG